VNDPIDNLIKLFYSSRDDLGKFFPIEADELSPQYQSLLAHHDHMTVTLEAWHNSLVEVHVLEEHLDHDNYSRRIVLVRQRDNVPVLFGIMQVNLAGLPDIVRLEIESQALPLGRIMIPHHLLREVEACQMWRVLPGKELQHHMHCSDDAELFGRTARILVEGRPAVELLEIVLA
jgi:chorismate-pyruvate lyase